jgi:hypothetical protein
VEDVAGGNVDRIRGGGRAGADKNGGIRLGAPVRRGSFDGEMRWDLKTAASIERRLVGTRRRLSLRVFTE